LFLPNPGYYNALKNRLFLIKYLKYLLKQAAPPIVIQAHHQPGGGFTGIMQGVIGKSPNENLSFFSFRLINILGSLFVPDKLRVINIETTSIIRLTYLR
jgi:hypothetical protein